MEKLYDRIDWNNNTSPALNETNLNLMSKAIDDIDDRVVDIAGTVMETVPQIQEDLTEAEELVEDAQGLVTHPPIIGQNGNWWTWDTTADDYVDSGIDAGVSLEIGETTTLAPGEDATVENVGTATDPVLNFGIPQGATGQNGQDGQDGVSPEVTITTITDGHTVTITDADHPTGQSFNVMDGEDGEDGVGVPAGGTTGQVLAKASGTDYDTEWVNASGGSGGHTILNGSGSAMTQRTNLQFVGATVSDDSANDATVVTIEGTSGSGQRYLEQTVTTSTSQNTTATFTDAAITNNTALQVVTTNGISSSAVTTTGQTVVTIPPQASASQIKVRLYFLDSGGGETKTLLHTTTVTTTGGAVGKTDSTNINTSSYKKIFIEIGLMYNNSPYYAMSSVEYDLSHFSFIDAAAHPRQLMCFGHDGTSFGTLRWTSNSTVLSEVRANTSWGASGLTFFCRVYGIK